MDKSYAKKRLLEKYPATQVGVWSIHGEDPNCDLGGSHHEPHLETVTGTYSNVVEYALKLPGFFQWGSGGCIRLIPPHGNLTNVDVPNIEKIKKLEAEKLKLLSRIDEINTELKSLA